MTGTRFGVAKRLRNLARPLRRRDVRIVAVIYAVTTLGHQLTTVALPFAVLALNGSAADIGLVMACRLVAGLVCTPLGGVWADRAPRARVMSVAELVSGAAVGAAAVLVLTDTAQVWHLALCAAGLGVGSGLFNPATLGLVRGLAPDDELQATNSSLFAITSCAIVVGPAFGGLVTAWYDPGIALAANMVTFVVSALLLGLAVTPDEPESPEKRTSVGREIRDGLGEVWSRPWLMASMSQSAVFQAIVLSFVMVLGPVIADERLGGAGAWGVIVAGFGLGTLVGGLVAGMVEPKRPLVIAIMSSMFILPTVVLLSVGAPVWTLVLSQGLTGVGMGIAIPLRMLILQQHVPDRALSRVYAVNTVVSGGLDPVGRAVAGPVAVWLGVSAALWASGAVFVAVTLAVLAMPSVRRLRRKETEAQSDKEPVVAEGADHDEVTAPPART